MTPAKAPRVSVLWYCRGCRQAEEFEPYADREPHSRSWGDEDGGQHLTPCDGTWVKYVPATAARKAKRRKAK